MKRPLLAALALAAAAAPATASAASIEVASSGSIVYTAAPGEVNALQMEGTVGGGDLRMAFFEFAAPLTAGPGCVAGFPVLCGEVDQAFPVDVALGDEKDVARVNSFTSSTTLDAGSGSDDVLAGGFDATADGGSGNDTVRVAANDRATGNGGTGSDRLSAGLGAAAATLDGGSGNDLLVPGGFLLNEATGGSGDDRLVSLSGRNITLSGQSGNDVLVATAGAAPIFLNAGSGIDIVSSKLGGVTVDGGSGHDVIDVRGDAATDPDTVTCGSGFDIVWANGPDTVGKDCELELKFTPPALPKVTDAVAAAQALLAHTPDPS
jgi:Ca2+-binding RTX toxin-like protein